MSDSFRPVHCSPPDSSVLHYLLEFAQIVSIELTMLSNHLITLPLYDDCTKLWICPMSLKKRDFSLKPKYTSHSFNRCLSNNYYALTRTTNLDLSFASGPHYIPPAGHPLLPVSLHNIPCSGHTLLSYLCIVTSLLAPPLLNPGTHTFKTAQASFPPRPS